MLDLVHNLCSPLQSGVRAFKHLEKADRQKLAFKQNADDMIPANLYSMRVGRGPVSLDSREGAMRDETSCCFRISLRPHLPCSNIENIIDDISMHTMASEIIHRATYS